MILGLVAAASPGQDAGPIKVTAAEIIATQKMGAKAMAKFKEKEVEVSGTLGFVGNFGGTRNLVGIDGLLFDTIDPQPWATLCKGQKVTILGKFTNVPLSGNMKDCKVTVVSGDGPLPVTAEQLAKDAAGGPKALEAKYKGKALLVTGKILDSQVGGNAITYRLEGTSKIAVNAPVLDSMKDRIKDWKAGLTVTVAAEYAALGNGGISLTPGYSVEKK